MMGRTTLACAALFAILGSSSAQLTLPPVPQDLSSPVQIRVAFDGPFGMSIGWNTYQQVAHPTVHYGLTPQLLLLKASSQNSITYPTSRTWANSVRLSPLLPGTKYYYKIDSTNSTTLSFTTARIAGDPRPFTAALVVDMGVFGPDGLSSRTTGNDGKTKITSPLAPGEQTTIQRLVAQKDSINMVVHPGDFAYADAWLKEETLTYIQGTVADGPTVYEGLNEQFWNQLGAISSIVPYMVGPGNHEANCVNGGKAPYTETQICPQGQQNFTGYLNRFGMTMPSSPRTPLGKRFDIESMSDIKPRAATAAPLPPFWYSFDYGMTHFLIFDTETDFGAGQIAPDEKGGIQGDSDGPFGSYANQQLDFIKADLASVNRFLTPWVVAAGHRPWYESNTSPCTQCQTVFEPLFTQYNVDLVVHGHTHNMQRIMPIANGVVDPAGLNNPKAPMYIVNGAAGHFEGLDSLAQPIPPYVAFANDTLYGFSKLIFHDRHNLEVQFVSSATGNVLDSSTLYKKH